MRTLSHRTQWGTGREVFQTGIAPSSCLASFWHAATGSLASHPSSWSSFLLGPTKTAKWALWFSPISRFWCEAHKLREADSYSSLEEFNQTSKSSEELSPLILKGVWPHYQMTNAPCFPATFFVHSIFQFSDRPMWHSKYLYLMQLTSCKRHRKLLSFTEANTSSYLCMQTNIQAALYLVWQNSRQKTEYFQIYHPT